MPFFLTYRETISIAKWSVMTYLTAISDVAKVECQLSALKTHKAPGPDQIPTWVLKDFAPILAGPVAAIWNSSVREGFLPQVWKSAYLAPLPKDTHCIAVKKTSDLSA